MLSCMQAGRYDAEELLREAGWIRALARGLCELPERALELEQETWLAALLSSAIYRFAACRRLFHPPLKKLCCSRCCNPQVLDGDTPFLNSQEHALVDSARAGAGWRK
jgi:DNA-directed RNA polymerase specialized sigma24 family protein